LEMVVASMMKERTIEAKCKVLMMEQQALTRRDVVHGAWGIFYWKLRPGSGARQVLQPSASPAWL